MRRREINPKLAWGGLIFGLGYALFCAILTLTGVVGGGVWFTVVAMLLLAVSSGIQLFNLRRRDEP